MLTARKIVAVGLAVIALTACPRAETPPGAPAKPRIGRKAKKIDPRTVVGIDLGNIMPPYKAEWLDGKPFDLAAERGHVVFLNVWATWCAPCRAEMPYLQRLQDQYAARGLRVIGVSVDSDGPGVVKEFLQSEKIRYANAVDPEQHIVHLLQTTVVPASVLLDRTGHIVWKGEGQLADPEPSLTKAIEQALAAK